jgi:mRNA interferase MazF
MRRGDIVAVSLDPVRGAESSKARPAIVVSNDAANSAELDEALRIHLAL